MNKIKGNYNTGKCIWERLCNRTFRQLMQNTPDGYAFVWVWGDIHPLGDYEEHTQRTIGLDGI